MIIENSKKEYLKIAVSIVIAALLLTFFTIHLTPVVAEKVNCSRFASQEDAQAHYQKSLDRNHDGIACSSYHYK